MGVLVVWGMQEWAAHVVSEAGMEVLRGLGVSEELGAAGGIQDTMAEVLSQQCMHSIWVGPTKITMGPYFL